MNETAQRRTTIPKLREDARLITRIELTIDAQESKHAYETIVFNKDALFILNFTENKNNNNECLSEVYKKKTTIQ